MIVCGVEILAFGADHVLSGAGKWLGGILIFAVIGALTAPVGIPVRYAAGKLPIPERPGAVAIGIVIGLMLIPLLHPVMYPPISMGSHPMELLLLHSLAGAVGGLTWYMIEAALAKSSQKAVSP